MRRMVFTRKVGLWISWAVLLACGYAQQVVRDPKQVENSPLSASDVIRRSLEKYHDNLIAQRDYLYEKRQVQRELDNDGKPKKIDIRTYEISMPCGGWYERLVAKNDQPLKEKESKKEQEKLDKYCAKQAEHQKKRANAQSGSGVRGEAKRPSDKDTRREAEFAAGVGRAFLFQFEPEEHIEGRPVWVIRATPDPAFRPENRIGKLLKKITGRIWVDQSNYQWVKSEADLVADFSGGWFLFKLYRGTHLEFAQTRVNDETWLPQRVYISAAARVALKSGRYEMETLYSNYRKFRVNSEIKGFGAQAAPPK